MLISVLFMVFIFILFLYMAIKPIEGKDRPNILTMVATTHILAGIILVGVWGNFIQQMHRGYINPQARIMIFIFLTLSFLILISTGVGLLRLKKWAMGPSFIITPFLYAIIFFIVSGSIVGVSLAPLSLFILIATFILEAVYVKRQGVKREVIQENKVRAPGKSVDFSFILNYFSWFKKIKYELLAIIICLLLLVFLRLFGI
jgi:hypothetical protein